MTCVSMSLPVCEYSWHVHHCLPRSQSLFFSFLDDVDRITSRDYEPSDGDVLHARLRTVGVQERRFYIEKGDDSKSPMDPVHRTYLSLRSLLMLTD